MKNVEFNSEHYVIKISKETIAALKLKATADSENKYRLCLHKGVEDSLHEMVIVQCRGNYIRPHKHPGKTESFHLIEGAMGIVIFDNHGTVADMFLMEAGDTFLFRLEKDIWHTVIPVSDYIVFHEITNGPFMGCGDSVFPQWAPDLNDEQSKNYYDQLQILMSSKNGHGTGPTSKAIGEN